MVPTQEAILEEGVLCIWTSEQMLHMPFTDRNTQQRRMEKKPIMSCFISHPFLTLKSKLLTLSSLQPYNQIQQVSKLGNFQELHKVDHIQIKKPVRSEK